MPRVPTRFSDLLRRYLRNGTRPGGTPDRLGQSWTNEEFADAIGVEHGTLRKWLSGARRPKHTIRIESGFFGDNPAYQAYRRELREAHEAARHRSGLSAHSCFRRLIRPDAELTMGIGLPWPMGEWPRFRDDVLDKLGAKTLFEHSDLAVFSRSDFNWSIIVCKISDGINKERF